MTIFVSSCRNKLTKKYAKKNGTPCMIFWSKLLLNLTKKLLALDKLKGLKKIDYFRLLEDRSTKSNKIGTFF